MTYGASDFTRLLRLFRVLDQSPIVQGIGLIQWHHRERAPILCFS